MPRLLGLALGLGLLAAATARAQELPSRPISLAGGRITLGTDLTVAFTPEIDDDAWFNYTDYEHDALRLVRLGVTADVRLSDRLSFLTELRSENGGAIKPYAFYLRVRPWTERAFDIQAGRIPPTFGAFSRRDYGAGNPLIGYPLAYQYLTSLRADAAPATTDDLLRMRGRGWQPSYPLGSLADGPGMPLITAFRWDTGVQVRVGPERMMVSAAVTNGTVSDPHTKDNNGGKQISARAQWRPAAALAIGGSAARGPYLSDEIALPTGSARSTQSALGVDVEYSRDYWILRGEAIWSQWEIPTIASPVAAGSAFVEGSYKVLPGMFVAARLDRLGFSRITSATQTRTWDAPITRVESGIGYYIRRNLLAKGVYQYNWRDGGLVRTRGLFAAQLHFWL